MALKYKVFILSFILSLTIVIIFTWVELFRWKTLSRSYTEEKGATLVKTISPLISDYIDSNNKVKIKSLVDSLASRDSSINDIVSVIILDSSKIKIAEAAPNIKYKHNDFLYFPPTVVIEKPLIDSDTGKELGFIQIVFSNDYFVNKGLEVLDIAFIVLIFGIAFSVIISRVVAKHIEKPVMQLVSVANKVSDGNLNTEVNIENTRETFPLSLAFQNMINKIIEDKKGIIDKNNVLELKIFEMEALKKMNHSLSLEQDIDEIYTKLADNVLNLLNGIQTCFILVVDEIHNNFEYRVVKGLDTNSLVKGSCVPIDSLLASKVYQTGENLIINETRTKSAEGKEETNNLSDITPKVDKSFYMPIIVKGKVVAILSGKNKLSGEDFSSSDISLLEGMIKETSIAIRNALMWQNLHRKVVELNSLHEIAKSIGTVLDIDKLLEKILDHTSNVFDGVKSCSIILYDENTNLLNVKLYKGDKDNGNIKPIRIGEGIAGKVFQRGEPIIINDMHTSEDEYSVDNGSSSICVPLKIKEKCLGVLSITDKISGEPFDKSDLDMMVTLASQIAVSLNNAKLYEDLEASYLSAVRALANSIDAKDKYTMGHSERVAKYSLEIGKEMNLSDNDMKTLYIGALLHDIGKIGIPEAIINKQDRLTNEEFNEIKTHPTRGAMIIEPAKFLKEKVPLIKHHHERFDGKGYPDGLKGEEIPLLARIICCADSFDAMTSKRAYRDTMPLEDARKEMIRCCDTQFDPVVVKAFLKVIEDEGRIEEIRKIK